MNQNKLEVSIIIPTMNRYQSLKHTINSMLKYTNIPEQIVVIDQTDDNKMRERIQTYLNNIADKITVSYYYQSVPSSTVARNLGIQKSKHNILVFSDDDIEVEENTIKNIYEMMKNPKIGMIGALNTNDKERSSKLGYLLGTRDYRKRNCGHVTTGIFGKYPPKVSGEITTEWAMGYFFSVKKILLNLWGIRFDEKFIKYAYAEDLDFTYRYYKECNKQGIRCILSSNVKVAHLVSSEYRVPTELQTYMFLANRLYLFHKLFRDRKRFPFKLEWANIFFFLERLIKKEKPLLYLKCYFMVIRYRKDISDGIMHYDKFN